MKTNDGDWRIRCLINEGEFSPKSELFKEEGKCPFCNENAFVELETRKKEKLAEIKKEEERIEFEKKQTLEYWVK